MHIKNTRCSFQIRSRGTTFIAFTKCYFLKKGQRIQFVLCYRLRQWRSILHVLGASLQAFLSFPRSSRVPWAWNKLSPAGTHKSFASLLLKSAASRACRKHSPPSVTTTSFSFSFVLVLWHNSMWHGCTRKIQVLVSAVSIIIMEWNKLACLMRSADGQRPSVFYSFKSLQASTLVSYQQYPQQHWSESWAAEPNNINRYIISFFWDTGKAQF